MVWDATPVHKLGMSIKRKIYPAKEPAALEEAGARRAAGALPTTAAAGPEPSVPLPGPQGSPAVFKFAFIGFPHH